MYIGASCERHSVPVIAAFAATSEVKVAEHPARMDVPEPRGVNWEQFHGTDHLAHQMKVEYPADSIIASISKKLSENGWQPLKKDFWNPGLPLSQVSGWTQFTDATVHPEATVDAWVTQWQNQAGDVAWCYLQYRYPPQDRFTLFVNAGFIPENKVKNEPKTAQPRR